MYFFFFFPSLLDVFIYKVSRMLELLKQAYQNDSGSACTRTALFPSVPTVYFQHKSLETEISSVSVNGQDLTRSVAHATKQMQEVLKNPS